MMKFLHPAFLIFFVAISPIIRAQNCSVPLNDAQVSSLENEIQETPLAANSNETDEDLVSLFQIVKSSTANDEFEIFTVMHTESKIIYDINGLSTSDINPVINSSCAFRESKKRDVILRFFTIPERKLEKIVLLK